MATDQNDRLLRAILQELRDWRADASASPAPEPASDGTVELREPATAPAPDVAEPAEPAPKPPVKKAPPKRGKK